MPDKKPCPACGQSVRDEARFCCFCEHEFAPQTEPMDFPTEHPPQDFSGRLSRLGLFLMVAGILVVLAAALKLFF